MILRRAKTNKDIRYILNHLRPEDKEEMIALYGKKWKKKVFNQHKKYCFDVLVDVKTNRPFIMGGIDTADDKNSDVGVVWMLTTKDIYKHKFECVKIFMNELKEAKEKFFLICNNIYKSNDVIKNFAIKLGFKTVKTSRKGWECIYLKKEMKGLS